MTRTSVVCASLSLIGCVVVGSEPAFIDEAAILKAPAKYNGVHIKTRGFVKFTSGGIFLIPQKSEYEKAPGIDLQAFLTIDQPLMGGSGSEGGADEIFSLNGKCIEVVGVIDTKFYLFPRAGYELLGGRLLIDGVNLHNSVLTARNASQQCPD